MLYGVFDWSGSYIKGGVPRRKDGLHIEINEALFAGGVMGFMTIRVVMADRYTELERLNVIEDAGHEL